MATIVSAQRGGGNAPQPPPSPRAAAPIDLTGYWVAIVNEDWRWRMVTPPKGDYASIQNLMTPEARKLADAWDPATDGSCLAYGAAGLMRIPTRLNVTWENDNTLKIETDAGQQTRRLLFDKTATPGPRSLQGLSIAEWERPGGGGRGGGGGGGGGRGGPAAGDAAAGAPAAGAPAGGPPAAARGGGDGGGGGRGGRGGAAGGQPRVGNLKVVTTNLSGGWLRKNGVPYSENATVTEFYDRFSVGNDEWMVITTIVADPKFLTQEFVTSTHFRREADGAKKWDPTPCKPTT
jgi:hypothetical protein